MQKMGVYLLTALVMLSLSACTPGPEERALHYEQQPAATAVPVYRFAVHPMYSPHKLLSTYQPLMDYLNARLVHAHLEMEASRDYPAFEAKIAEAGPAFLLPNPVQTLLAQRKGYQVLAMAGDASDFKGLFIVRKDSGIHAPHDLRGKVVSFPSPTALAGAIMPQYFLHQQGLDVQHELTSRYVGSQESSILSAYVGDSAAAATWPPPWRMFQKDYPAEAAQLKPIWETVPLINNSVMAHTSVPPEVRQQLQRLLLDLRKSTEGAALLGTLETAAFYPANDQSYDVVRRYVRHFERTVRPVELPFE